MALKTLKNGFLMHLIVARMLLNSIKSIAIVTKSIVIFVKSILIKEELFCVLFGNVKYMQKYEQVLAKGTIKQ